MINNRIFLTGDTHGRYDIMKLIDFADGEGKTLTKQDKVIILGDFGFIWDTVQSGYEDYWHNWFNGLPWQTLFLDGNHENFNRLDKYKKVKFYGGKAGHITDSIIHLLRGETYWFNEKSFLVLGGADSIDFELRTKDISWWPQEAITDSQVKRCTRKQTNFDFVLTHAAPTNFVDDMYLNNVLPPGPRIFSPSEAKLQDLADKITYKKWYCGHYHCDFTKKNFNVLYNNIVELDFNQR